MKRKTVLIAVSLAIVAAALIGYGISRESAEAPEPPAQSEPEAEDPESPSAPALTEPVPRFRERVTKKPFGIYVEPGNSPVSPERFRGYHTGADAEFDDTPGEVTVRAVGIGRVLFAGRVSGYGGVVVIRHTLQGASRAVLYGHLDPGTLPARGAEVSTGERIGVLGAGGTPETDGERKHLHLAVRADTAVDFRGYVSSREALSAWIDPLTLF